MQTHQRRRRMKPMPAPPPGRVLFFAGYRNVSIRWVEDLSRMTLECGTDDCGDWRNDPSYHWVATTKRLKSLT